MLLFPSSFALASDASDFFYNSENFEIFSVFVKTPIGINKINLDPNQSCRIVQKFKNECKTIRVRTCKNVPVRKCKTKIERVRICKRIKAKERCRTIQATKECQIIHGESICKILTPERKVCRTVPARTKCRNKNIPRKSCKTTIKKVCKQRNKERCRKIPYQESVCDMKQITS